MTTEKKKGIKGRKNRGKLWIAVSLIAVIPALASCSRAEEGPAAALESAMETAADKESPEENLNSGTDSNPDGQTAAPAERVSLTEEELQGFRELLNQTGYGNCLTCYYEEPAQISVSEIFYSLHGIGEPVSEEEVTSLGWEETLDAVKFPVDIMEQYLMERFGITLEQVQKEVLFDYLPEYRAYYLNAGDTNLVMAECISGTRSEDIIRILYTTGNEDGLWEVSLREKEGGYQFLANENRSAGHNRDYVEQVLAQKDSLQHGENENYDFYFRPENGELVCAEDKPSGGSPSVRTLYFENGECTVITLSGEDAWADARGAFCSANGRYIGATQGYYKDIGIGVLEEFEEAKGNF